MSGPKCNLPEAERAGILAQFPAFLTQEEEDTIRDIFPQYLFFRNEYEDDGFHVSSAPVRMCTCTACGETFSAVRGNWPRGKMHHEMCNCPNCGRQVEAIAQAANAAAEAERAKHEKAEKELREQIAALAGQVKTESGNREKLEKQLREAEEKAAAAKKDDAEAEALRGEIEGLKKQLALAAPEVADFKAAFGRAQEELNHMLDAIARIGDEETRGKLRKAGLAMMEAYAGRLGA